MIKDGVSSKIYCKQFLSVKLTQNPLKLLLFLKEILILLVSFLFTVGAVEGFQVSLTKKKQVFSISDCEQFLLVKLT